LALVAIGAVGFFAYRRTPNDQKVTSVQVPNANESPSVPTVPSPAPSTAQQVKAPNPPGVAAAVEAEKKAGGAEKQPVKAEKKATEKKASTAKREKDETDDDEDKGHDKVDVPDVPDPDVPNPPSGRPKVRRMGGVTIRNFPDGSQLITTPDGMRVFVGPDG